MNAFEQAEIWKPDLHLLTIDYQIFAINGTVFANRLL